MNRARDLLAATMLTSLLALSAPLATFAQSTAPAPQTEVTHDMAVQWSRLISAEDRERAAASGWLALSKIAAARDDIHHRRTAAARGELDQVQSMLLNLREGQPIMTMRHRVAFAQQELEYTATDQMVDDLLPLATHLDAYATFAPVDAVKKSIDQAREDLKRNDKPGAVEQLQKVDEGIVAIETHLPITRTFLAVSFALDALSRNALDLADQSLASAERGLHVTMAALDKAGDAGKQSSAAQN